MSEAVAEAPKTEAGTKEPKKGKDKGSTKPGDPAAAAKKVKVEKKLHPALEPNAEGKPTKKLKEWPADFDSKVHKQLKRSNFEDETPLLEQRIKAHEKSIDELKKEIADIKIGGGKSKAKVSKLRKMIDRFAEIKAEMANELTPEQMAEFETMFKNAMSGTPSAAKEEAPKA